MTPASILEILHLVGFLRTRHWMIRKVAVIGLSAALLAACVPPPPQTQTAAPQQPTSAAPEAVPPDIAEGQPLARVDVRAMTCAALLAATDDDRAYASTFLVGYRSALLHMRTIEVKKIEAAEDDALAHCRTTPQALASRVFREALRRVGMEVVPGSPLAGAPAAGTPSAGAPLPGEPRSPHMRYRYVNPPTAPSAQPTTMIPPSSPLATEPPAQEAAPAVPQPAAAPPPAPAAAQEPAPQPSAPPPSAPAAQEPASPASGSPLPAGSGSRPQ
jgi:outer membrane biosynthesis protein TonB